MKKAIKILSLTIPMLILSNYCYGIEDILKEVQDNGKYIALGVCALLIVLIIYVGYKTDKKSEEGSKDSNKLDMDFPYEDEEIESLSSDDDYKVTRKELVDNTEYEEESLFNSAEQYVEEKEEESNDFSTTSNEFDVTKEENDDFAFDTNSEDEMLFDTASDDNEEVSIYEEKTEPQEETNDTFGMGPIFNVEEDVLETTENNNTDKKRFTRKKSVKELANNSTQETQVTENIEEVESFEESEDVFTFEVEDDDEYEEDDDVPTFDELLKKSEEEVSTPVETFDFMAEMEQNLKKNQEKRLETKASKSSTTKKTATKKTAPKKATIKKKKDNEE